MFGVSVHYIADELWEGLNDQIGRGQGFVRTLSSFNLGHDGMSDNDESTANLAADFGVAWELNETGIHPWKRYRHVFPLPFFSAARHSLTYMCVGRGPANDTSWLGGDSAPAHCGPESDLSPNLDL